MLDNHDREKFATIYRLLADVLEHEAQADRSDDAMSYRLGDLAARVFIGAPPSRRMRCWSPRRTCCVSAARRTVNNWRSGSALMPSSWIISRAAGNSCRSPHSALRSTSISWSRSVSLLYAWGLIRRLPAAHAQHHPRLQTAATNLDGVPARQLKRQNARPMSGTATALDDRPDRFQTGSPPDR